MPALNEVHSNIWTSLPAIVLVSELPLLPEDDIYIDYASVRPGEKHLRTAPFWDTIIRAHILADASF